MASRALRALPAASLDQMLAAIPSLPRPVLSRLVSRMIDHLDELDGDTDLEPEVDCCSAGDDGCGVILMHGLRYWGAAQEEP